MHSFCVRVSQQLQLMRRCFLAGKLSPRVWRLVLLLLLLLRMRVEGGESGCRPLIQMPLERERKARVGESVRCSCNG